MNSKEEIKKEDTIINYLALIADHLYKINIQLTNVTGILGEVSKKGYGTDIGTIRSAVLKIAGMQDPMLDR